MKRTIRTRRARLAALILLVGVGVPASLGASTTQYTYDALGRLTGVDYGNGAKATYTYDAAGNRTAVTVTGGTTIWGSFVWGQVNWQ
ncbi:RHS repeat domain-containing protein [Nitrospirillum sp. BR 11163]|uniref:RHS repeat domain-containing protein n=1 Tax=Nitrospirillum sp. BR 11163 TaxID=3104323 RepID=UPI002AFF51F5|nr:RHS repeat domain-containing protein [Nitrospirillum sp. BR 11163]MEA1676250.1 RHS repeat domain-containing protein [Nitrospirillum sp. BR 11163]